MAYTVNTGNVDTADPTSTTIVRDVRNTMTYLDEDNTQFTTMMMRMPQSNIHHYKFEWPEDELLPQHTTLSASITNSQTNITTGTTEGEIARPGDIARVAQTGEGMIITAVGVSGWTVVRGFGGTSGATAATSGKLVIIGNMNEQNAAAPTAVITARSVNYNYSGIFRDTLDFAGTTEVLDFYGEPEGIFASEKRKKAIEHKSRQERSIFWGTRGYTTGANSKPWTSAGGLYEFITTNRLDVSGSLTRPELQDILRTALQYGNRDQKVMFCSPLVSQVIGQFLADNWVHARPDDKVWGVSVDYVVSAAFAGKSIPVVVKGDWMRYGESGSGQYGNVGFIVDMGNVGRHPLVRHGINRDGQFRDNIQNPDVDGHKAEYLTEVSYSVRQEKTHTYFYNVQYAA